MSQTMKLSDKDRDHIIRMYSSDKVKEVRFIDSSRDEDDLRFVYCVSFEDSHQDPIVIKVSNNSFTTHERIEGWKSLCERYLNHGIYCPQILKCSESNSFSFEYTDTLQNQYIVYAEEYKKYKTVEEYIEEQAALSAYKDETRVKLEEHFESNTFLASVHETIGIIASAYKNQHLVDWVSPYTIYEKFSEEDQFDENYECAYDLYVTIKEQYGNHPLIEEIWNLYLAKRSAFEAKYRSLPKAVFQADFNDSNLLINEQLNFVGLIDFNLSGTDTILNYAICECLYFITQDDIPNLTDQSFLDQCDNHLVEQLAAVNKHYKFSEQELEAINEHYNIVVPFRYPTIDLFLEELKENNGEYLDKMLEWIHYQLTRSDIAKKLCLG